MFCWKEMLLPLFLGPFPFSKGLSFAGNAKGCFLLEQPWQVPKRLKQGGKLGVEEGKNPWTEKH